MTTYQLRRYELVPDLAEDFVAWVKNDIYPLREKFGFKVEWTYFDMANSQLIWMASADCNELEFEALDARWQQSDERAQAAIKMPAALIKIHASFVAKI